MLFGRIDGNDVAFLAGLSLVWYGLPENGPWIVGAVLAVVGLFGAMRKGN